MPKLDPIELWLEKHIAGLDALSGVAHVAGALLPPHRKRSDRHQRYARARLRH